MRQSAEYLEASRKDPGPPAGPLGLQRIAHVLAETVRDSDEVARIGGDEFSALLLQADDELAGGIALRLKRKVSEVALSSEDGSAIEISCSVGVALFPDDAVDAKALLRAADLALYNAKGRGRNQIALAGPGLRAMAG